MRALWGRSIKGGIKQFAFKPTLYIDLARGKIYKDGIGKIIFLCAGIEPKKKPPVKR
jgi:hypothetical protein